MQSIQTLYKEVCGLFGQLFKKTPPKRGSDENLREPILSPILHGNISIENSASIATEPERKKNLIANSDTNEGDLIDNTDLDEPDHAWDNYPDDRVVELLRARARRQAREKQNAVKELPAPKIIFPEQNIFLYGLLNRLLC